MKLIRALKSALVARSADRQQPGLVLGRTKSGCAAVVLQDADIRNHLLVAGRPGMGVRHFAEDLLVQQTKRGGGWIYLDPLPDATFLERLAAAATKAGRADEFLVLDLDCPDRSHTYDVLRSGTPTERAVRVLQVLPELGGLPDTERYADQCFSVLVPLLALADAAGRSVSTTALCDILAKVNKPCVQRELLSLVPANHPAHADFVEALARQQDEGVGAEQWVRAVRDLGAHLQRVVGLHTEALMSSAAPQICFADILAHNKMCLVRLPSFIKDAARLQLAKMILHDISTSLEARSGIPARTRTPFIVVPGNVGEYLAGVSNNRFAAMTSNTYSRARAMNVGLISVSIGCPPFQGGTLGADLTWANTGTKVFFNFAASSLPPGQADSRVSELGLEQLAYVTRNTPYAFAQMLPLAEACAASASAWQPYPCEPRSYLPRLVLQKATA